MKEGQPKSWWQTFSTIITGITGIISAIAGLVIALQQAGIVDKQDNPNPLVPISARFGEVQAVINDPDGYVNVRSGQGIEYEIIARIPKSQVFYTIPQGQSAWWPVRTLEGKHGYIHQSRVKIQN